MNQCFWRDVGLIRLGNNGKFSSGGVNLLLRGFESVSLVSNLLKKIVAGVWYKAYLCV